MMARKYKISVLPGDGIGREVVPEAIRVLKSAASQVGGIEFEIIEFECGGEYYLKTGREWSKEAEQFAKEEADAVLLGAIGAVDSDGRDVRLPDNNLAGYNVVIGLRLSLELYANVRPVKLYEGVPTPLADKTHKDIDMVIIRENTEGLYTPARGTLIREGVKDTAVDLRVITRKGATRVIRYAYETALKRDGAPVDGKRRVTCVDKSNLLAGCQLFRDVFDELGNEYPKIERDYAYVDAWTQWALKKPEFYDVVVAPNEFGDIITDLGGAIQGGLGMAPAGNIGDHHGVFEPVHGSAPKHYGQNRANPIAAILAGSMMMDWLGIRHDDKKAIAISNVIQNAVAEVLRESRVRTYDLCIQQWSRIEPSTTVEVTDEIIKVIESQES